MYEIIKQVLEVQEPFNMIIMVVFFGAAAGAVKAIATETRKYFTHRQDLEMKREMIDRGLSVEEIERVIRAGEASGRSKNC